jgi:hypothetical protein
MAGNMTKIQTGYLLNRCQQHCVKGATMLSPGKGLFNKMYSKGQCLRIQQPLLSSHKTVTPSNTENLILCISFNMYSYSPVEGQSVPLTVTMTNYWFKLSVILPGSVISEAFILSQEIMPQYIILCLVRMGRHSSSAIHIHLFMKHFHISIKPY